MLYLYSSLFEINMINLSETKPQYCSFNTRLGDEGALHWVRYEICQSYNSPKTFPSRGERHVFEVGKSLKAKRKGVWLRIGERKNAKQRGRKGVSGKQKGGGAVWRG
jgi:hypothetical protein